MGLNLAAAKKTPSNFLPQLPTNMKTCITLLAFIFSSASFALATDVLPRGMAIPVIASDDLNVAPDAIASERPVAAFFVKSDVMFADHKVLPAGSRINVIIEAFDPSAGTVQGSIAAADTPQGLKFAIQGSLGQIGSPKQPGWTDSPGLPVFVCPGTLIPHRATIVRILKGMNAQFVLSAPIPAPEGLIAVIQSANEELSRLPAAAPHSRHDAEVAVLKAWAAVSSVDEAGSAFVKATTTEHRILAQRLALLSLADFDPSTGRFK